MHAGRAERNPVPDLRGALKTPVTKHHSFRKATDLPQFLKNLEANDGSRQSKLALRLPQTPSVAYADRPVESPRPKSQACPPPFSNRFAVIDRQLVCHDDYRDILPSAIGCFPSSPI
jgi:hypothetical protein